MLLQKALAQNILNFFNQASLNLVVIPAEYVNTNAVSWDKATEKQPVVTYLSQYLSFIKMQGTADGKKLIRTLMSTTFFRNTSRGGFIHYIRGEIITISLYQIYKLITQRSDLFLQYLSETVNVPLYTVHLYKDQGTEETTAAYQVATVETNWSLGEETLSKFFQGKSFKTATTLKLFENFYIGD